MREIKFRFWNKGDSIMISDRSPMEEESLNKSFAEMRRYYEVMQFTGIQDSTGKDIYEGDICEWVDSGCVKRVDNVVYGNAKFYLCNNSHSIAEYINQKLMVIGNIYENPKSAKT